MPTQKFLVETDQGSFEIEVDMPEGTMAPETAPKEPAYPPLGQRSPLERALASGSPLSMGIPITREGADSAVGFAKEIVPAVGQAVMDIPRNLLGLVQLAGSVAGGVVSLAQDPIGTITRLAEDAKSLPAQAQEIVKQAATLAATDPEEFGRAIARLTAQAGIGAVTAKGVPLAVRPAAARAGAVMENVGTKGEWPIRMMGAHQLGAGNPLGIPMMSAPELLQSGGRALQTWGNRGVIRLGPAETRFAKDIELNLSKALQGNPAKAALKELDAAIAAEKKSSGAIRVASGRREAALQKAEEMADLGQTRVEQQAATQALKRAEKNAAEAAARRQIEETITAEGLVPGAPRVTESVRAPGQSLSRSYTKPAPKGSDLTPFEQELLSRATSVTPVGSGPKVTVIQPTTPPATPAAPRTVEVPRTQSRNPLSAIDDRLTENDMSALTEIVRANPQITAEEATAELLRQRRARASMYRDEASLNKLERLSIERDVE